MTRTIKNILQLPWMVKVTHTFIEGNKVADGLESMAFSRPIGRVESGEQLLSTFGFVGK
ncbi:hypothetical protein PVK06_039297 [Gossypium arboreum]|uniref:RNase H type-1 domain-containing protein n=1 Tax=Gossypium arboreum TaxID=29729 RepID=A0ABR0N4N1_GOSAR|nr:hypothetical protein PVK06_039297 [Gossypium arboreum]